MAIRYKKGQCIDCPKGGPDKEISAKRCVGGPNYHYQKFKREEYKEKSKLNRQKKLAKAIATDKPGYTIGKWFNDQITIMPPNCENCAAYLNPNAPWGPRAYIAHIVPKRFFLSVMLHPLNRVFLCIDCHTKFDNSLSVEVEAMKVYKIAAARFETFKKMIDKEEVKHLSPAFDRLFYG